MTVAPAETSIRRLGLRQRWDRLPSSDALKNLLEESALWTALWTGSRSPGSTSRETKRSQP